MLTSVSCKYLMCKWGMHSCGFMITHCASGPSVLCSPFPWVPGVCGEEWGRACPRRLHLPGSHSYWLPTGSDPGERLVRSKEGGRSQSISLSPSPPHPRQVGQHLQVLHGFCSQRAGFSYPLLLPPFCSVLVPLWCQEVLGASCYF